MAGFSGQAARLRGRGHRQCNGAVAGDKKNPEDFYEVIDIVEGGPLMQAPDAFGCKLGSYT